MGYFCRLSELYDVSAELILAKIILKIYKKYLLSLPKCAIIFLSLRHVLEIAGVAEWQTQQTQNLPGATSCRFKSGHRHKEAICLASFFAQTHIETEQLTRQLLCF